MDLDVQGLLFEIGGVFVRVWSVGLFQGCFFGNRVETACAQGSASRVRGSKVLDVELGA